MKYIIIFLLFSFNLNAQNLDIKTENNIKYKIEKDTSDMGVITIIKTPLNELGSELRSYINELTATIDNIDLQIAALNSRKAELIAKKKDYRDILIREGL